MRKKKVPKIPKPKVKKVSQTTLRNKADKLAGEACRSKGYCEAEQWMRNEGRTCEGRLEWAHVKKRHHLQIRHHPDNCKCLCNKCHWYFTNNEDRWVRFLDDTSPGLLDRLHKLNRELTGSKPDYAKWIEYYEHRTMHDRGADN